MDNLSNDASAAATSAVSPDNSKRRNLQLFLMLTAVAVFVGAGLAVTQRRSPTELLAHARGLAETGRPAEAIAELQKSLPSFQAAPEKVEAHELLGDLHRQVNFFDQKNSTPEYDLALKLEPDNGRLHFKRASSVFGLANERASAIAGLLRSLELGYTNADTFYMLGSARKFEGDSAQNREEAAKAYMVAAQWYLQGLGIDSKHAAILGNMGDIAFNMGMDENAAAFYRKVLSLPLEALQEVTTASRLAHVEIRLGHFEDAIRFLDTADAKLASIPAQKDPLAGANAAIEGVRILVYKLEAIMGAAKKQESIKACEALLARIASAKAGLNRHGMTSGDINRWEQFASDMMKQLQN